LRALAAQNGSIIIREEEMPQIGDETVLIRTAYSTISPGTELTSVSRSGDRPAAIGYSAAGIVVQAGDKVKRELPIGQRVACYGGPYVRHAEYLAVHKHLVVPVPDHVKLEYASSVGLGGIAIHAVRQANLQFGETAVIVGLGIIGQLVARICRAACYRVIACDLVPARRQALAGIDGIHVCASPEDVQQAVADASSRLGADAVILCASGKQKELIDGSFDWIRDRGKIVIVGDLQMEFTRAKMFKKEAQVLISRAAGAGRYDSNYEALGFDYPVGYARWTEGRNLVEYIRLLSEGHLDISQVLTSHVALEDAHSVYAQYKNDPTSLLGAVIDYQSEL
jgi:NADPH2:quinone reductase